MHNSGDLALTGVRAAFYDGDPAAGGILLVGTVTAPEVLAAGAAVDLSQPYLVSTSGVHVFYALADPGGIVTETFENDNQTSTAAFLSDLSLTSASVAYWGGTQVGLVSQVTNDGSTATLETTLAYLTGDVSGTPIASQVIPALAPGESVTLTTPWDAAGLPSGENALTAVLHSPAGTTESTLDNNQLGFSLLILPDAALSPYYLWLDGPNAAAVNVTVQVFNQGAEDISSVPVVFYTQPDMRENSLAHTETITSLPAGAAMTRIFSLAGPLPCGLSAAVDPGLTLTK